VGYRLGRLADLMAPYGAARSEEDAGKVAGLWRDVRDVLPFADGPGDVWRISVKPTDGPDIAERTGGAVFLDWGGGLIWARVPEGTDLRARLGAFAGHATLVRASAETRARIAPFQPEPAPIAALSEGLRHKFDPRGILNPGLMAA
jgi:glycolate oxidase FAD binding subunit